MSFILDALRKSENARQRHGGPALAEVPIARRRENKQWWIAAVAALLLINVIVLAVVLIRDRGEPEPVAAVPGVSVPVAPASPAAPPPPPVPAAAPSTPVTAPIQPAPMPNPAAANTPPAAGHSLAEEAAGAVDLQRQDAGAPTNGNAAAANVPNRAPIVQALNPNAAPGTAQGPNENLPTLNELTGDRALNMPAMHLDIHVYSDKPAERFVFINMRKYTEGATLTEGPVVERIRTDGVVLNQQGFRFVLPRQ